jgi:hypothetical protein
MPEYYKRTKSEYGYRVNGITEKPEASKQIAIDRDAAATLIASLTAISRRSVQAAAALLFAQEFALYRIAG